MRRIALGTLALATLALAAVAPAGAELLSKTYQFKENTTLEIGVTTDSGIRIDAVRFQLPATSGGRLLRTAGLPTVEVAVSNTGAETGKVGIAVALFDERGRLLAVASGGSRLLGIKTGRQKSFTLVFDDVNAEVHRTDTFQISVEAD